VGSYFQYGPQSNEQQAVKWTIIDTGVSSAERNMEIDGELLEGLVNETSPILHLYSWDAPSATYGHFIDPYTFLNVETVRKRGLDLARRPTGGGIIFHTTDFAFSLLVPATHSEYSINTLDNYAFVNALVIAIVRRFMNQTHLCTLLPEEPLPLHPHSRNFCMAKPTKFDVMLDGRKVGGGAQRRTKHGYLHQGSISLAMPEASFLESLVIPEVLEEMQKNTYALLGSSVGDQKLSEARQELRSLFVDHNSKVK